MQLGLYQHYKGNQYNVIAIGRHSETLEPVVIYQALYGDHRYWVRPMELFTSEIEVDGEMMPRFRFIATTADELPALR